MLPVQDLGKAADGLLELDVDARTPGEDLGHLEGLGEEPLHPPGSLDRQLLVVGQLLLAEDGDDVLEVLVLLQDPLDPGGDPVVLLPDDAGIEGAAGRVERVHGGIDADLGEGAGERHGRPQVGKGGRDRRVGEVVRRDVDGLDRGDRTLPRGGDALLEIAHLGGEGGLVADRARHPSEQRRDLGPGEHVAEDVVDEEEDVGALLVAEVLGHGEAGESDPGASPGRLVHLPKDQRGPIEDPGLLHVAVEVAALAGALSDPGEDRVAAVLLGDVADHLVDDHRLAHPSTAEEADLGTLGEGADQVDDLEPGLQDLLADVLLADRGRLAVDGVALRIGRRHGVDGISDDVEHAAQGHLAHRDGDRRTRVHHLVAAAQAVGRVHGDGPDHAVAQILLDLQHQPAALAGDLQGIVGVREPSAGEGHVDDGPHDLDDPALAGDCLRSCHLTHDSLNRSFRPRRGRWNHSPPPSVRW